MNASNINEYLDNLGLSENLKEILLAFSKQDISLTQNEIKSIIKLVDTPIHDLEASDGNSSSRLEPLLKTLIKLRTKIILPEMIDMQFDQKNYIEKIFKDDNLKIDGKYSQGRIKATLRKASGV